MREQRLDALMKATKSQRLQDFFFVSAPSVVTHGPLPTVEEEQTGMVLCSLMPTTTVAEGNALCAVVDGAMEEICRVLETMGWSLERRKGRRLGAKFS